MARQEVALFVTCLINNIRPSLGFDVVSVLEKSGFKVVVPEAQTCCGQPNYNGGDPANAKKTARQVIDMFSPYPYIVVASGSCGGMIKHHYPELLADDPVYGAKASTLAAKVFELSSFLVDIAQYVPAVTNHGTITYHDACAGLRELGVKQQPRQLLNDSGYDLVEMDEAETCCGFGGTFCVKYPQISNQMLEKKIANVISTEAKALVSGDLGCILNMQGKLHRDGKAIPVYHFAELLADRGQ